MNLFSNEILSRTVSCSQEVENKNKNVCKCVFTTNVRIVSKNNARQHRGKTSYGSDPHEQVVKIPGQKRNCLAYHGEYGCVQYHKEDDCLEYHVTFSDNDFDSDGPVYKHLDQIKGEQRLFLFRFTSLTF